MAKMEKPEGVAKVRVRHMRMYPEIGLASWAHSEGRDPLPHGGATFVSFFGEKDEMLATGMSKCRSNEAFNRRRGREIAWGRAAKEYRREMGS